MKYNLGDKVLIVSKRTPHMNSNGKADHWLGKIMTIRECGGGGYRMYEDRNEWYGNGWHWTDKEIVCSTSELICEVE